MRVRRCDLAVLEFRFAADYPRESDLRAKPHILVDVRAARIQTLLDIAALDLTWHVRVVGA